MTHRRWTPDQDSVLRKDYHLGADTVARRLNRTAQAVYCRAHKLGLVEPRASLWSEREERILIARYVVDGPSRLASELGRSVAAVQTHARALGLAMHRINPAGRRPRRDLVWTTAAITLLTETWGRVSLQEIAASVGTTETGVRRKAERLGLPFGARGGRRKQ